MSVEGSSSSLQQNNSDVSPGEYVLKKLFTEFVLTSQQKLDHIAQQSLEYPLAKELQKGEDAQFDQLLNCLNEVASFCLTSLLTSLFNWRNMKLEQYKLATGGKLRHQSSMSGTDSSIDVSKSSSTKHQKEPQSERMELAIEFLFCLVLTEVLTKLSLHPVPESLIHQIEDLAFKAFKTQETKDRNPNAMNMKKVADLFGEVIGVLSLARFSSVRRRFLSELRDSQNNQATLVSIIDGMKFVRVKMFPVEEIEDRFAFLQECAKWFIDSRDRAKQAMSALLVDILLPVGAVIDLEASLPAVKKFVTLLYSHCIDQCRKVKHHTTCIPLVTAILSVSEKQFFLENWHVFLNSHLLPNLRRDAESQRVVMESLYRLLWVYVVRVKCEGNVETDTRLRLIIDNLFPRGTRGVQPKDAPLTIFVKVIQFVAMAKMKYAMNEVILDLVSTRKGLNPERINIGLRAFLLVADSLEKNEGNPPMPIMANSMPSGSAPRVKTKFLSNTLTEEIAKGLGLVEFYPGIKRALDNVLRALDASVGKNMLSTFTQTYSRSQSDLLSGERKPKLDLLKTCVASIPRIMPEGMSRDDLVELLSRLTIHIDHELARSAFMSLQNIITNYPSWRHDVAKGFVLFILRDIPDSCPLVIESALKMLGNFLTHWKAVLTNEQATKSSEDRSPLQTDKFVSEQSCAALHWVESLALVAFCSYRPFSRRVSLLIMKEAKSLLELLGRLTPTDDKAVIDVIDDVTPTIIERYLSTLSAKEAAELSNQNLTLSWLADRRTSLLEEGASRYHLKDAWSLCISGLLDPSLLPQMCPTAIRCTWQYVVHRMQKVFQVIDPGFSAGELSHKGSTRGRKTANPAPTSSVEVFLWRNYLLFAACTAPPTSAQEVVAPSALESSGSGVWTARDLFRIVVPLLCYDGEIREVAVTALGMVNPQAFGDLLEELHQLMREVMDRRHENSKRVKRRKDLLRVQITTVLELTAEHGCFRESSLCVTEDGSLSPIFLDFIESVRSFLESESDKDFVASLQELRLRFSGFIANLINSFPRGERRLRLFTPNMRFSLFFLYSTSCGYFGTMSEYDTKTMRNRRGFTNLSITALQAMSALLCCGPAFDLQGLAPGNYIYQWLNNMLHSNEPKVQKLARKTLQLLLHNNKSIPALLHWTIDQCYANSLSAQQQCFHALANILAYNPNYPCNMISVLHVVLYKTADPEQQVKERAAQLLHILDKRFFGDRMDGPELMGCVTSTYSNTHIVISQELAKSNPELTLPLLSEMVYRFEMAPTSGQRSILQYMVPWLRNVELVSYHKWVGGAGAQQNNTNEVLHGSGWGSKEGTQLVLHNLLFITAKFGNDHGKEVEQLWCALCDWSNNARIILDYLIYMSAGVGSNWLLEQAKKVVVFLGRAKPTRMVRELIKELESVELVYAELDLSDRSPYVHLKIEMKPNSVAPDQAGGSYSQATGAANVDPNRAATTAAEGKEWLATWKMSRRMAHGQPVPLPLPSIHTYYANMNDMLHKPSYHTILHRCNFALIFLSELVIDLSDVNWADYLPQLLHILCLGLDLHRPLVFEHSKKLLINLVIFLACREDKVAATSAKVTHRELSLRSPSTTSLFGGEDTSSVKPISHADSLDSLIDASLEERSLSSVARDLIHYISEKSAVSSSHWPFEEMLTRGDMGLRSAQVSNLEGLVERILGVFRGVLATQLQKKWSEVALRWATSCSSRLYASKSFQICRALHIPLSANMFSDVLTRLAEHAADHNEDVQNYVMEILLTLETAVDYTDEQLDQPPVDDDREVAMETSSVSPVPTTQSQVMSTTVSHALSALDVNVIAAAATSPSQNKMSTSPSRMRVTHRHSRGPSITRINDIIADHASLTSQDSSSKLVVTLKQQQQGESSSSHYTSPKHQSAVDSSHVTQPVTSEVAPGNSPTPSRKANSTTSTPTRSPTHRRHRMANTETKLDVHRHGDSADKRLHDHAPAGRRTSEQGNRISSSRKHHQRPASWMGGNTPPMASKDMPGSSKVPQTLHKIVSESRVAQQHKLEHKAASSGKMEGLRSHHGSMVALDIHTVTIPGLLSQLFWTSVSLLESDYEQEFTMALRLLNKAMDKLDLQSDSVEEKLKGLLEKLTWPTFPGVQSLLLKGLSSNSAEAVLKLLARITPLSIHPVFDPSEFAGFPLNVMSLMPVLMKQFDAPDQFCITCANNIQQVCTNMANEGLRDRLVNMAAIFDMYAGKRYSKPVEMWAAAVCRYLSSAYPSLSTSVLRLLVEMLEKGPGHYHKSVLKLICEYLKLTEQDSFEMATMNQHILSAVEVHIKGSLWQEACEILKFAVSNSATLVAPPTRIVNLPLVDIGSQPLPGPTLQFSIDLHKGSRDFELTRDANSFSVWKKPQACQRRTRERLLSVLNTCGAAMTTNPSVIFDDESIIQGYSSVSDATSIRDEMEVNSEMLENSQRDSQIFINDQFNFLDHMDTSSESDSEQWEVRHFRSSSVEEFDELRTYPPSGSIMSGRSETSSPEPTARMLSMSPTSHSPKEDRVTPTVQIITDDKDGDIKRRDSVHSSRDSLPQIMPTQPPPISSKFINVSFDEIEEYWREHVSTTLRDKSGVVAVNTFFLFNKLFMVIRQSFINLTKETCNYLEKGFKHLISHYLNAVEVVANQFECPKVFIDAELFTLSNLLEQHVFHVMEIQSNIIQYMEKRKIVLECLTKYKAKMQRDSYEWLLMDTPPVEYQMSSEHSSPCASPLPVANDNQRYCEEALQLCQALYQFHFQLLILLGNYVKLLSVVNNADTSDKAADISEELTMMQNNLESVIGTNPSPSDQQQQQLTASVAVMTRSQAIRKLEELLSKKQALDCVLYLRSMRKRWKGDVFGSSDEDDIDALFSIYSNYLVCHNERVLLCMTHRSHNLFEVHNHLLTLNVTLRSMLDIEEAAYHEMMNVDKLSSGAVSPSPSNEDLTDHDGTAPPTTRSPDQDSTHLPFEPPPPLLLNEPPLSDEDALSQSCLQDHVMTLPLDHVTFTEDHVSPPEDYANPSQDPVQDHVSTTEDHVNSSQEHASPPRDHVNSEDTKDSDSKSQQSPPSNHGDQEDSTTIHELSVSPDRGPSPRQLDDTTGQLDDGIGPPPRQIDDSPSPQQPDEDNTTDQPSNNMNSSHDTSSDTVDANMSTSI
ncbi:protein furry homolog isoform X2 [Dysidea avara]|uniref:protein furry homolog isoform X2 n=1 Tax=Dysidea avara TaxID=196820 RepID=UPI00332A0626